MLEKVAMYVINKYGFEDWRTVWVCQVCEWLGLK